MIFSKKSKISLIDLTSVAILFMIVILICSPVKFSNATLVGAKVFCTKVLPTLLPFFFLSKLLVELGFLTKISKLFEKITNKLFGTSGQSACIFLTAILCGYPMGAKLTSDLYLKGEISSLEATKIASFTSTSGPMFIVGTVGASIFLNIKLGFALLASHIIGAVLCGVVFGKLYSKTTSLSFVKQFKPTKQSNQNIIDATILSAQNALESILIVGTYVILFYLFIELFFAVFPISNLVAKGALSGFIELTRGAIEISKIKLSNFLVYPLMSFALSFGGISVHLQCMAFLSKCGVRYKTFFAQKLLHGIFATIIMLFLTIFI